MMCVKRAAFAACVVQAPTVFAVLKLFQIRFESLGQIITTIREVQSFTRSQVTFGANGVAVLLVQIGRRGTGLKCLRGWAVDHARVARYLFDNTGLVSAVDPLKGEKGQQPVARKKPSDLSVFQIAQCNLA